MKRSLSIFSGILSFVFVLVSTMGWAQDKSLFQKDVFTQGSLRLPYRILYPEQYDASKKYPLIVFLHGAGERGHDNEAQLTHGANFFLENRAKFPAIVIAPQCPEDGFWANVDVKTVNGKWIFAFGKTDVPTPAMQLAMGLVKEWLSSGKVDKQQVYIGGLSMGGMGTFEMLWRMPNVFAAAFPICGGGDVTKAKKYAKHTAVWVFHGAKDNVVPVKRSQEMVQALQAAKAVVLYTEYPEANHNSWDNAFREPELMPWLFLHKRQ